MYMNVYVVAQIFILGVSLSFYNLFLSLIVYDDKIETVGNKIEPQHILVLKFNAIFHLLSLSFDLQNPVIVYYTSLSFNIVGRFC